MFNEKVFDMMYNQINNDIINIIIYENELKDFLFI